MKLFLAFNLVHSIFCGSENVVKNEPVKMEYEVHDSGVVYGGKSFHEMEACGAKYWVRIEVSKRSSEDLYNIHILEFMGTGGDSGLGIADTACTTTSLDKIPKCWMRRTEYVKAEEKLIQTAVRMGPIEARAR